MESQDSRRSPARPDAVQHTIVGLFEDSIDAERALRALRASKLAPERVSLLVRDTRADMDKPAEATVAVARAIVDTALEAVAGWLQGLVSLILPERGTFLVAGPLGAALAGVGAGGARDTAADRPAVPETEAPNGLLRTLTEFGFGPDEARYLESRLVAGAAVIAVTTGDADVVLKTRQLFADHDAVHIGLAESDAGVVDLAEAMLAAPPEQLSGDVVVADAVASLQWGGRRGGGAPLAELRHRHVLDAAGEDAGTVEDIVVEVRDPDGPSGPRPEELIPRYLVVGFGGVLGVGRRLVALPIALADVASDPVRVEIGRELLHRAPALEAHVPLSRRDEEAIAAFFGVRPYWLSE
jgi:hypothetical protein